MSSQGPNSPTAATTSNANGGTVNWSSPANAETSDGLYTTASAASATTYRLLVTGFGFTIPAGTVDGILVEVQRRDTVTNTKDAEVKLIVGGTVTGNDKADTVTTWPALEAYASYGGAADLWGLTPTVADVNASNFGVSVSATLGGGMGTAAGIDHVRVTVYYTASGGTGTGLQRSQVVSLPFHPTPPGRVIAPPPAEPFTLPAGNLLPVARPVRGPDPPGFAGAVYCAGPGGPFAIPAGAPLPLVRELVEAPRAGHPGAVVATGTVGDPQSSKPIPPPAVAREAAREVPGGRVIADGKRAEPIIPYRPLVQLPKAESARPGDPGGVKVASSAWPMDRKAITPAVVREVPRSGDPGRVQSFASPPPPFVRLPTGQRMVIRDVGPVPPAGGVTSRMAPTQHNPAPTPRMVARRPDTEPGWLAGWVYKGSTVAPPEPAGTRAAVSRLSTAVLPPGSVGFWHTVDRAEPPGRLVPRSLVVREPERAGYPGRVIATHAAWDFALPELTPIFESVEAPSYRSSAASGFNTGTGSGVPVFRARRVP